MIFKWNLMNLKIARIFFQYINKGPYPDEEEKMKLYSCFCKIYNPSMKDREILKATESKSG